MHERLFDSNEDLHRILGSMGLVDALADMPEAQSVHPEDNKWVVKSIN